MQTISTHSPPAEDTGKKPLSPKTWQALQQTIDLAKQRKNFQINDEVDWIAVEQHARHTFNQQNVTIDEKTLSEVIEHSKLNHGSSWVLKEGNHGQKHPIEDTLTFLNALNISTPQQAWDTFSIYQKKWQRKYRNMQFLRLLLSKEILLLNSIWVVLAIVNFKVGILSVLSSSTAWAGCNLMYHWMNKRNDAKWLKELKTAGFDKNEVKNQFGALLYFLISWHLDMGEKKAEKPSDFDIQSLYERLSKTKTTASNAPISPRLFISEIVMRPTLPFYFQQQLGKILKTWMQQPGGLNVCHFLLLEEVANELETYFVHEEKEQKYMEEKQAATHKLNNLLNL